MSEKTDAQLAKEHADWIVQLLTPIIHHIAYEEFLHGYKHGQEAKVK